MGQDIKTEQLTGHPDWWTAHKSFGEVLLTTLAEDDDQPRWVIVEDDEDNMALVADIKENGVYENLIVTPRHLAPWVKVKPEEEDCFFVIVAGHRRNWASKKAGKTHAPIEVRIYPDEDAYRKESVGTNTNRKDLSALEEAYVIYYWRYPKNGGEPVSWERIAVRMSMSVATCHKRMRLTRLAQEIQMGHLHPKIPKKDRLGLNLAERLVDLNIPNINELKAFAEYHEVLYDFDSIGNDGRKLLSAAQIIWLKVVREMGLGDKRAIQMIDRGMQKSTPGGYVEKRVDPRSGKRQAFRAAPAIDHSQPDGSGSRRHQPARMLEMYHNYWKAILEGLPMDWTQDDFDRAFSNSSLSAIEAELQEANLGLSAIKTLIERIERTRDRKKAKAS